MRLSSWLVAAALIAPAATLKFDVPAGWVSKAPSSSMRVAEFTLPRATGDAEDASLVVYFFGGQGGSAEANIQRWIDQMAQPDGKPSKTVARTSMLETHGLQISLVDVIGTYVAEVSPGSAEHYNKPGFRLRAAVVVTPGGPYFVKLLGPLAAVTKSESAFDGFLKSLRFE